MTNNSSHFYIYHFDIISRRYRKIIRFDIKDSHDDMYFIDESLNEETSQLSFHTSGKVHIKHYGNEAIKKKEYVNIFDNSDLFKDDRCHQFLYYKLGNINHYPLVPSYEILQPNFILKDIKMSNKRKMFKFLIGKLPLKSNLIHKQHTIDQEGHINPPHFLFRNKAIIVSLLIAEGEDEKSKGSKEYDDGIHIILFNSRKEILDEELFKKRFDIGKPKTKNKDSVQIDRKEETVSGESIFSIFYRINQPTFRYTFKYRTKLFLDWVNQLLR